MKYLERLNVRLRVLQARDALADAEPSASRTTSRGSASRCTPSSRSSALRSEPRARELEEAKRESQELGERATRAYDVEVARIRADVEKQIDRQVRALSTQVQNELSTRVENLRAPARSYLDTLSQARADFEKWFAELQRLAARRAADIPPPPKFPEPPPELVRALDSPLPPLDVPAHLDIRVEPRAPKAIAPPNLPDVVLDVPTLDVPAAPPLGAALDIEEVSVGGGAKTINSFDQQVPGFSVTFLLLGLLLGVSLGVLDERDWGTFDRIRAMPVAAHNVLLGKLAARFIVGMAQMILLFAVGYFFFGDVARPTALGVAAAHGEHRLRRHGLRVDHRRRRAHPRLRAAARRDRDHVDGRDRRLLVADRSRAALDAHRRARAADHLGDGIVQRSDDPPARRRGRAEADRDAPRVRARVSRDRSLALSPPHRTALARSVATLLHALRHASTAFVPPNANELVSATSTSWSSRAAFGT